MENEDKNNFLQVLNQEEMFISNGEVVKIQQEDPLASQMESMEFSSGPAFAIQGDRSLASCYSGDENSSFLSTDEEDNDDSARDSEILFRTMSPITPRGSSVDPEVPSNSRCYPARRHNTGKRSVRGCGRGACGRRVVISSGEGYRRQEWTRGEPYVERYSNDEELPALLRKEIDKINVARERRERKLRDKERANVRGENDENAFAHNDFIWESMGGWTREKEAFVSASPGPTQAFNNAYDAFRSYWDDSLLSHIVRETNGYAQNIRSEKFRREWFNTNLDEILILFVFWMMLGIIKMPTIKSCFSIHPIMRTDIFRSLFTESRYWNVNRAFHLFNGSRDTNDSASVLYLMGPVLDILNAKFKANYTLHRDICIEESLTVWKGRVGPKYYTNAKSVQIGIKNFQLCESSTGYLWSFLVNFGRKSCTSTLSSRISTVVKLVQPLLDLGHVLYMDTRFNSPTLARYLKSRRTDCVGTLRPSRNDVPAIIQIAPLAEGEFVARQAGDVMVVALQDRRRLTCLSTFHGVTQMRKEAAAGQPAQCKLQLIEDYNKSLSVVDRLHQMLEPYVVERKQCAKWTNKLFKRLLNITIQNARVLVEKSTNSKIDSLCFRLDLVHSIINRHRGNVPCQNLNLNVRVPSSHSHFPSKRLTEPHFIDAIPITDEMRESVKHTSNLGRRRCVWCTAKDRRSITRYECPDCKVALCIIPCFKEFHTIP